MAYNSIALLMCGLKMISVSSFISVIDIFWTISLIPFSKTAHTQDTFKAPFTPCIKMRSSYMDTACILISVSTLTNNS